MLAARILCYIQYAFLQGSVFHFSIFDMSAVSGVERAFGRAEAWPCATHELAALPSLEDKARAEGLGEGFLRSLRAVAVDRVPMTEASYDVSVVHLQGTNYVVDGLRRVAAGVVSERVLLFTAATTAVALKLRVALNLSSSRALLKIDALFLCFTVFEADIALITANVGGRGCSTDRTTSVDEAIASLWNAMRWEPYLLTADVTGGRRIAEVRHWGNLSSLVEAHLRGGGRGRSAMTPLTFAKRYVTASRDYALDLGDLSSVALLSTSTTMLEAFGDDDDSRRVRTLVAAYDEGATCPLPSASGDAYVTDGHGPVIASSAAAHRALLSWASTSGAVAPAAMAFVCCAARRFHKAVGMGHVYIADPVFGESSSTAEALALSGWVLADGGVRRGLDDYAMLFVPVVVDGEWALVVVDFLSKRLAVIDPITRERRSHGARGDRWSQRVEFIRSVVAAYLSHVPGREKAVAEMGALHRQVVAGVLQCEAGASRQASSAVCVAVQITCAASQTRLSSSEFRDLCAGAKSADIRERLVRAVLGHRDGDESFLARSAIAVSPRETSIVTRSSSRAAAAAATATLANGEVPSLENVGDADSSTDVPGEINDDDDEADDLRLHDGDGGEAGDDDDDDDDDDMYDDDDDDVPPPRVVRRRRRRNHTHEVAVRLSGSLGPLRRRRDYTSFTGLVDVASGSTIDAMSQQALRILTTAVTREVRANRLLVLLLAAC